MDQILSGIEFFHDLSEMENCKVHRWDSVNIQILIIIVILDALRTHGSYLNKENHKWFGIICRECTVRCSHYEKSLGPTFWVLFSHPVCLVSSFKHHWSAFENK